MAEYKQPIVVPNADIGFSQDPNKLKAQDLDQSTGRQRVSAGDPASKKINRHGELELVVMAQLLKVLKLEAQWHNHGFKLFSACCSNTGLHRKYVYYNGYE